MCCINHFHFPDIVRALEGEKLSHSHLNPHSTSPPCPVLPPTRPNPPPCTPTPLSPSPRACVALSPAWPCGDPRPAGWGARQWPGWGESVPDALSGSVPSHSPRQGELFSPKPTTAAAEHVARTHQHRYFIYTYMHSILLPPPPSYSPHTFSVSPSVCFSVCVSVCDPVCL